mmetsp:Transcript_26875/g.61958  ORF Transcript_26875/g.61958 Transcript_26875/m.61958 type:complete len:273 (-) Transcript_26875:846-1664(-)
MLAYGYKQQRHQQDALLVDDHPGLAREALDDQVDDVAHLGRARVLVLGEEDVGGQGLVHGLAVLVVVRVEGQLERLDARHERDAERRLDRRAGHEGDGREVERAPVARALELVRAVEDAPDAEGARALKGVDDDGERAVLERVDDRAAHGFRGGARPEDGAGRRGEAARGEGQVERAHLRAQGMQAGVPRALVLRPAVHHLGDHVLGAGGGLKPGVAVAHDGLELGGRDGEGRAERVADGGRAALKVHVLHGLVAEERAQALGQVLHRGARA